jgi:hypothetical protein
MEIHQVLAEAIGISDADRLVVFTFEGHADTLSGRVRFCSPNPKRQVLKHQLNDDGTCLLPKVRAINVRVTLTHL